MRFSIICSALFFVFPTVSSASFVELGASLEEFQHEGRNPRSFTAPYIRVLYDGINNIELGYKVESQLRHDPNERDSGNRIRNQYFAGYKYQLSDNFTLKPSLEIRDDIYANGDHFTEYRFQPYFDYTLSDSLSMKGIGFVAPWSRTMANREWKSKGSKKYLDWKAEYELRVTRKLANRDNVSAGLFYGVEFWESTANINPNITDEMAYAQLRLYYQSIFNGGHWIQPYARINLSREYTSADGRTKDEAQNRYGFIASYRLTKQLSVLSEIYYQPQEANNWDGTTSALEDLDKMYYKIFLRHSF